MKITKISILKPKDGADIIYVKTDLPSPFLYPQTIEHSMQFECTQGTGEEYVKKNFPGILYTVLDI